MGNWKSREVASSEEEVTGQAAVFEPQCDLMPFDRTVRVFPVFFGRNTISSGLCLDRPTGINEAVDDSNAMGFQGQRCRPTKRWGISLRMSGSCPHPLRHVRMVRRRCVPGTCQRGDQATRRDQGPGRDQRTRSDKVQTLTAPVAKTTAYQLPFQPQQSIRSSKIRLQRTKGARADGQAHRRK